MLMMMSVIERGSETLTTHQYFLTKLKYPTDMTPSSRDEVLKGFTLGKDVMRVAFLPPMVSADNWSGCDTGLICKFDIEVNSTQECH